MKQFTAVGALPKNLDLKIFEAKTLEHHGVSWHKGCRVKYSSTILTRKKETQKRTSSQMQDEDGHSEPLAKSTHSKVSANSSFIDSDLISFSVIKF